MKHYLSWGMSVMLLTACTGGKQAAGTTDEAGTLPLPVSEKQLCIDWYTAFVELIPDLSYDEIEDLPAPKQYIVTDLDHDGLAEVMVQGEVTMNAAMLSYDKEGKVKFVDLTNDGYLCLGIGDGWYVREHDDHMGEYRTWTRYYYKVADGKFDFIGDCSNGLGGVDAEGEPIENETQDNTEGQAPAWDAIKLYDELEGWTLINDDALSDARTVLADGECADGDGDCECGEPEDRYFAGEVVLDSGLRLRLDYKVDANDNVMGATTYYRSNGKTSRIPFFGTHFYDHFVNQDFINVSEYYNGKCCGHMLWSVTEEGELNSGTWQLGDKKLDFESYEAKEPDTEAEYTSPSLDFHLADQLLPCPRQTLKELFAKAYPESGPANYFMLVDMDMDGVFEVFVLNGFGSAPKTALVWMQDGQLQVMGFGQQHEVYIHFSTLFVKSAQGDAIYRWQKGKPVKDTSADASNLEFFDNYSQGLTSMGEWLSM